MQNKISAGAKKDLLIINFVIGLIQTSMRDDDAVKNDKDLTKRTNKDYKLNKRIDRRLERLSLMMQETQNAVYRKYGADGSLGRWVTTKLNTNLIKLLNKLSADTNLELLANQVLFEAFKERNKPLIEEFEWLREFDTYSLYDLLVSTEAGKVGSETYEDAQMIVMELR